LPADCFAKNARNDGKKLLTPKYLVKSKTKEHIMDTPAPSDNNSVFESFPQYQNFPSHWDLSELEASAQAAASASGEPAAQFTPDSAGTEPSIPLADAYPVFSRESFPKHRTFPVFWDLSR
jgi:hypothetical protein